MLLLIAVVFFFLIFLVASVHFVVRLVDWELVISVQTGAHGGPFIQTECVESPGFKT